ncbi:hypothetical protein BDW68DRAFT_192571 [Aspergillus falconensis]
MATTSRGRITLSSADATQPSSTGLVIRAAIRQVATLLLGTPEGQGHVEAEVPRPGVGALGPNPTPTDEEIDAQLRVKGAEGLQVVDASVLPLPVTAHYQALVYAIAHKAAGLILG